MSIHPPLVVLPHFPNRWDDIFAEDAFWPLSHFLIPLCAYVYMRSWWKVWLVVYWWETFEKFMEYSSGKYFIFTGDTAPETSGDSLMGDPFMGILGIFTMYLMLCVFKLESESLLIPANGFAPRRFWQYYIKYLFQFGVISTPTFFMASYLGKGYLSVGYLVFLIGSPLAIIFFGWWNSDDQIWCYRINGQKNFNLFHVPHEPQKAHEIAKRLYLIWALFVFVFLALAFIHWLNMWMLVLCHAVAFDLLFLLILLHRYLNKRNSSPVTSIKNRDTSTPLKTIIAITPRRVPKRSNFDEMMNLDEVII